jgi:hypothetical protein
MSRKSRRNRARQPVRRQQLSEAQSAPVQKPLVAESPVTAKVPVAPVTKAAPRAAAVSVQYDHVMGELRRIGLLAAIMVVILVILVIILS